MQANSILRNGKVWQLVDPNLSTECHNDKIERMILAASLCIRRVPQSRPRIALVSSHSDMLLFILLGLITNLAPEG